MDTVEVGAWKDIKLPATVQKPILVVQGKGPTGKKSSHDHLVAAQNRQVEEPQTMKELTESNECDCRKWLLPVSICWKDFFTGTPLSQTGINIQACFWIRNSTCMRARGQRWSWTQGGSQEDRSMEKMLASSKLDMEETANKIRTGDTLLRIRSLWHDTGERRESDEGV